MIIATQPVKKIAVLRANALGDFIFSLPALQALRTTYPKAEIVLLGKKWHEEFLKNRPSPIDRVLIIPPAKGVSKPDNFRENEEDKKTLEDFFQKIRQEKFDIGMQIHGGGRYSNPFIKSIGVKLTIGTKTEDAVSLDKYIPYRYYQSEILRWLEVVSLINAKTSQIEPKIEVTQSDSKEASRFVSHNKPFVVLHPGATDIRRRWSPQKFAEVGDAISTFGFQTIITGTENEKTIVADVIHNMKFHAINLCGKLSLSGLTGLLANAQLVISNDTGPLHLAHALNTATIGIYWCGNVINGAPLTRNNHIPLISWITYCPLCRKDIASYFPFRNQTSYCKHELSFVDEVRVEEVIHAAKSILDINNVAKHAFAR